MTDDTAMTVKELVLELRDDVREYRKEAVSQHAEISEALTAHLHTAEAEAKVIERMDVRLTELEDERLPAVETWQTEENARRGLLRYVLGTSIVGAVTGIIALATALDRL